LPRLQGERVYTDERRWKRMKRIRKKVSVFGEAGLFQAESRRAS
jgi:hypothetical protein